MESGQWCTPLIPADRGTQISEFEASLVFRVSSRTVRDTQRNSDSKAFNPSTQAYLYECYASEILSQTNKKIALPGMSSGNKFSCFRMYRVSKDTMLKLGKC